MAFRWFCGFGISEDLFNMRALTEFRNAVGQRLFASVANALVAGAEGAIDEIRGRRKLKQRTRS